jgi:hypothetical protein
MIYMAFYNRVLIKVMVAMKGINRERGLYKRKWGYFSFLDWGKYQDRYWMKKCVKRILHRCNIILSYIIMEVG